jgi:hypothetical protein
MSAAADMAPGLSIGAMRLRQYVRWTAPASLIAGLSMLGVYAFFPSTVVLLIGVVCVLNTGSGALAHRLAGAERVDSWSRATASTSTPSPDCARSCL